MGEICALFCVTCVLNIVIYDRCKTSFFNKVLIKL